MIPSPKLLRQMIETAMKDRAPELHRELKSQGQLDQELADRVEVFDQVLDEVHQNGLDQMTRKTLGPLQTMRQGHEIVRQAVDQALAAALEFPTTELRPEVLSAKALGLKQRSATSRSSS